jgi:DNA-binding response OmpR family regulator
MEARRVLVVEDEPSMSKVITYALEEAGYEVAVAEDGATARTLLDEFLPDIVVLDVMLPGESGLDLCREVRSTSDVPIIMLSAKAEEVDRIVGLELGADDYMTKPFSPRELVSRVKARLRRAKAVAGSRDAAIVVGDIRIDTDCRVVYVGDDPVHLTNSEFEILALLARYPGKAYSRQAILAALWGGGFVGEERTVDVHIHNIREKVEPDPRKPEYLLTVRGHGYRLREA